ncbi:hypothetical protein Ddye_011184 [Dipteronia dyeriana]|uniref:MULE transposase domain-containing protein n=1 Tax=Dipteronia dyeriana TaxID=168575 RepID=A0AAD9XF32_9ROSI|nr:hypothetical protein Ddye_011184 [Dipteronia dyeriana]
MSDNDVEFVIIHKGRGWATIDVEFVNKSEFRPPPNPIQSPCTVSNVKSTDIPWSLAGTPNYKSVSGSNNLLASQVSPGFTSACNDQAMPASTTNHAVMDDNDSSGSINTSRRSDSLKTSDTKDESASDVDGGQAKIVLRTEERGVSGTLNSSSPSMNTRWTVSGSELYSIKAVQSVDMFDNSANQGDLFASKYHDLGCIIHSKDIVSEMREQHGIHLSYNKVYRLKEHALNQARTRGVLLVGVWKDGNEMIYPLAFGFANSKCTKSWTWISKKLHKLIQYLDRVLLVSDRHNGIFNAMEDIFPYAAHGICAYHLVQNLKRFCKQRDDVILLYYRAMYAYCIEDFDHLMIELKETYHLVYDELQGTHTSKIGQIQHNGVRFTPLTLINLSVLWPRFKGMKINSLVSDLYTTGFLKHAYEMGVNPVPDPEF